MYNMPYCTVHHGHLLPHKVRFISVSWLLFITENLTLCQIRRITHPNVFIVLAAKNSIACCITLVIKSDRTTDRSYDRNHEHRCESSQWSLRNMCVLSIYIRLCSIWRICFELRTGKEDYRMQ